MASAREADGAQKALDRATIRDRDTTVRLRKAIDATVSSLLRAGYDRAAIGEAICGFLLNALASAAVPACVVDAIVTDSAVWVQRRLAMTSATPRYGR